MASAWLVSAAVEAGMSANDVTDSAVALMATDAMLTASGRSHRVFGGPGTYLVDGVMAAFRCWPFTLPMTTAFGVHSAF